MYNPENDVKEARGSGTGKGKTLAFFLSFPECSGCVAVKIIRLFPQSFLREKCLTEPNAQPMFFSLFLRNQAAIFTTPL